MRRNAEALLQSAFFQYLGLQHPKLRPYCFAIPNGGSRHPLEAINLKRQGVTAGVPDILFAYPMQGFHGLFIELKSKTGRVSPAQRQMLERFGLVGYKIAICRDLSEAIDTFKGYLCQTP